MATDVTMYGGVNAHRETEPQTWRLVERYVANYPDDWRCVFRRGNELIEISVPEDVWRAFGA